MKQYIISIEQYTICLYTIILGIFSINKMLACFQHVLTTLLLHIGKCSTFSAVSSPMQNFNNDYLNIRKAISIDSFKNI